MRRADFTATLAALAFCLLVGGLQADADARSRDRGRGLRPAPKAGVTGLINALSFAPDGTDDFALGAEDTDIEGATKLQVGIWVKADTSWPSALECFISQWGFSFSICADATDAVIVYMRDGAANVTYKTANGTFAADTWYYLHLDYDAAETGDDRLKLYVNGVHDTGGTWTNTAPDSIPLGTGRVTLAASTSGASGRFGAGNVDEAVYWINKAASDAQVLALYGGGTPTDPNNSSIGTPDWWVRCGDGDTDPTISDQIGSNDLTITNGSGDDFAADVPGS